MIELHVGLSGMTRYAILDEHGDEISAERASNLILNRGLDNFASEDPSERAGSPYCAYVGWRGVLHLGTGSAAPDVAQFQLENAIGSVGAQHIGTTATVEGAQLVIRSTIRADYPVQAAANLTEYGLGPSAQSLSIRELFRDAQGVPVVLSVQTGQTVRVTHVLTLAFPLSLVALAPLDLDNGGTLSTVPVSWGLWRLNGNISWDRAAAEWKPGASMNMWVMTAPNTQVGDNVPYTAAGGQRGATLQPYIAGSYRRVHRFAWGADQVNGLHYGYTNSDGSGVRYTRPDGAALYAVQSGQTVTLDVAVSWGRA